MVEINASDRVRRATSTSLGLSPSLPAFATLQTHKYPPFGLECVSTSMHSQAPLTMAPFFPDGIYKIRNGEYTHFVADLIGGTSHGPISAYTERASNQHDKVCAISRGGLYSLVR